MTNASKKLPIAALMLLVITRLDHTTVFASKDMKEWNALMMWMNANLPIFVKTIIASTQLAPLSASHVAPALSTTTLISMQRFV